MPKRFGIAGCGNIAPRHAASMARVGELVAAFDLVKPRAERLVAGFGGKSVASFEELLKLDLDAIAVCTPNYLHAGQSVQALKAGHHVLCEKPMSLSVAEGRYMEKAARAAGKLLFVVKQNRFNPPVKWLKEQISAGKLGRISSFQVNCFWHRPLSYYSQSPWRGKADLDGGVLFTQFSHFIDLILWCFGEPKKITAIGSNVVKGASLDGPDAGAVLMEMEDGTIGTLQFTVNAHDHNMEGSLTVFAENATVKIGGQYLNELSYFSATGIGKPDLPQGAAANEYGSYQGSMSNHHIVYDEFVKAMDGVPHDLPSASEAMQSVALIEKIHQAIKK